MCFRSTMQKVQTTYILNLCIFVLSEHSTSIEDVDEFVAALIEKVVSNSRIELAALLLTVRICIMHTIGNLFTMKSNFMGDDNNYVYALDLLM